MICKSLSKMKYIIAFKQLFCNSWPQLTFKFKYSPDVKCQKIMVEAQNKNIILQNIILKIV